MDSGRTRTLTEPAFRPRLRKTIGDRFFPSWSSKAACSGYSAPGAPWSWMFADEVAERADGEYDWPDKVIQAMEVCARCPVRCECAEWAFDFEKAENQAWWDGSLVEQDRRFGIFGGLPGRIRERLAHEPDRLEAGEAWFQSFARKRGWLNDTKEERSA